jgi:hypothetical protein
VGGTFSAMSFGSASSSSMRSALASARGYIPAIQPTAMIGQKTLKVRSMNLNKSPAGSVRSIIASPPITRITTNVKSFAACVRACVRPRERPSCT